VVTPCALAALEPAQLVQKDLTNGHRRSRPLQVRHERLPDRRVRRQLTEMHPTHPAGRDVSNQKRPSGQSLAGKAGNQLFGTAGGRLLTGRPGPVLRVIAIISVAGGDHRGPAATFGGGKVAVCLLYTSPSPRDLSTSRMPSSA